MDEFVRELPKSPTPLITILESILDFPNQISNLVKRMEMLEQKVESHINNTAQNFFEYEVQRTERDLRRSHQNL